MAKKLQLRRGTAAQHDDNAGFTGAAGEVTVDTTTNTLRVHNNSTKGGIKLALASDVPTLIDEDNMASNDATKAPSQQSVKAYVDAGDLSLIDEDNMSTNSATRPPSQQSTKAYVDTTVGAHLLDEDNFATDSATKPPSQQSVKAYVDAADALKANLAGPTFTGTVTIPTPSANDNTTKAASTAYVQTELGDYALKAGPTFTGVPAAPTAAADTNTTQIATTAYVQTELGDFAPKAAPAFTGTATGVNLTLSGNLTVNGTTTTVASTNTTISDNLLELNSGASSNANDSGILIERGSTGDNAIIAWDESVDKFTVGTTTGTASSTGDISITTGTLVANVEGAVTGNASTATTSTNVTLADESSDTSCNVLFATAATGDLPPKTGTNLTFNSSTGDLTATIVTDGKGNVRSIPQNTQGSAYELLAADAGKHILASGNITWVDSRHAAGDAITIVNNTAGNITIVKGTTMYNAAGGANENRTLATRGVCTILWASPTVAYISGAGLT